MLSGPDQQNRAGCVLFSTVIALFLILCLALGLYSKHQKISPSELAISS